MAVDEPQKSKAFQSARRLERVVKDFEIRQWVEKVK